MLNFSIELDLERGEVHVFGRWKNGYEYFIVAAEEEGIVIFSKKGKKKNVFPIEKAFISPSKERLSLGSHKALDWELVKRRRDLSEIFPAWFRLGQMVPDIPLVREGVAGLLKKCDKLEVIPQFLSLFLAGFHGILAPRLVDDDHQGIIETEKDVALCPLGLLTEGSKLIRSLFFEEKKEGFVFLPTLPPQFHSGRFTNFSTSRGDVIDLEWSKKLLRHAVIFPSMTHEVRFFFQKSLKSFREKGKRHSVEEPFLLEAGKKVYLDRFETV